MSTKAAPTFSRRRLAIGFAVALAFPAVPAVAGKKLSGKKKHPARDSEAKKFLGSIYQHYVGKSSTGSGGVSLTTPGSVRSYFTVGLASLILDDRAAAAKRGAPPVLNTDPFVGRREWDISELSIDVKDTGALKTVGTVSFMNAGRPEKIVLELLRSGAEWRIADIEWDSGSLRGLYRRKAAYDGEAAPPQ